MPPADSALFLYRLAQSVIGVMLSFSITAKSLQTLAANWVPVIALVLTMLALTTVIGILLRRVTNLPDFSLPIQTSYLTPFYSG